MRGNGEREETTVENRRMSFQSRAFLTLLDEKSRFLKPSRPKDDRGPEWRGMEGGGRYLVTEALSNSPPLATR